MRSSRRKFLGQLGAVVPIAAGMAPAMFKDGRTIHSPRPAQASDVIAQASDVMYDLLIVGGRVVDAAQKIADVRDVAIVNGKIARVAANIPTAQAKNVFNAAGKLVSPGLIDMHGHVYDDGITTSTNPDVVGVPRGVTTIVDAGSTGAENFAGFRKYVIERAHTRIYVLLNISRIGCCLNELYMDPRLVDTKAAIETIEQNRSIILGIKVRINGRHDELAHDIEVLKKAREASDATGVPIMVHWSNEPDLHAILKRGDIMTHPFNPPGPNSSNLMGGEPGKILPQVLALKDRGIWTDFAHGGHLTWDVAEAAAKQGWFPDSISTDITRRYVPPMGFTVFDLVTTMSKFIYLGLSVEQVLEKVTSVPTRMLKFPQKIGTLEPNAVADISILNVEQGNFQFLDSRQQKRVGHQRIVPVATVVAGKIEAASATNSDSWEK